MTSEQLDEKAIFNAARQIASPDERVEYLQQACGTDDILRARVEVLLRAYEEQASFLEQSPLSGESPTMAHSVTELVGDTIGPYKLLQQIAEGGMGVVFMAEQEQPVHRRVALKVIKPGMDTRQVIARFEAERQALAMMDHPNIAKVFDAGTTHTGRPYFVMELVKGSPITQYCDEQKLSPRERLELFVPVCQAVQHAHQKGIIHRDIKPSNVLVACYDDRPVPKIIDFGVAKAIEQRLTEKTVFTEFGQVVGTPEYMSPEQAKLNQLDIDTRTDVYSLGVLLYELLTGETPFNRERLRSAAFDELLRIIREEDPPRPSAKLSTSDSLPSIAANRHVEPKHLSSLVHGELDWIVMKALEKDRARRYDTASNFAEDVQHYLNDEPVEACPPSAAYRFRKFARRNKLPLSVALTIFVGLALLAIVASATAGKFRELAHRNAILAEDLTKSLDTAEQNLNQAQMQERQAKENLAFARKQEQHAQENMQLATTEQQRAEGNLDLALSALDVVYLDAVNKRERAFEQPGFSFVRTDLSEAEREMIRTVLTFYSEFARRNQNATSAAAQTARAYYRAAMLQGPLEGRAAARLSFTEAIHRFEALVQNEPKNHAYRSELAQAYYGQASLQTEWGDTVRDFRLAEAAVTAAIDLKPDEADYYFRRSDYRFDLGDFQRALADGEKAVELSPKNTHFLGETARKYVLAKARNIDRAIELCTQALNTDPHSALAHQMMGVALYYRDKSAALEHTSEAIRIDPTHPGTYNLRARIYNDLGDYEHALAEANESIRLGPHKPGYYVRRCQTYMDMGRYGEAKADIDTAEKLTIPGSPFYVDFLHARGSYYARTGDFASSEADYTQAIERRPVFDYLYAGRFKARIRQGKFDGALDDLRTLLGMGLQSMSWPMAMVEACPDAAFKQRVLDLLSELIEKPESDQVAVVDYRRSRCRLLLAMGRLEEARRELEYLLEHNPEQCGSYDQYLQALTCLMLQDEDGYRDTCRTILVKFAATKKPMDANFTAWTTALFPDAISDFGPAIELARSAVEKDSANVQFQTTLGAVLYRGGQYHDALERLTASTKKWEESDDKGDRWPPYGWFFLAMAYQKVGNAEQARAYLNKATQWTDERLANTENPPAPNQRATLELFRQEAQKLIDQDHTDRTDSKASPANKEVDP